MSTSPPLPDELERYLRRLRTALRAVDVEERDAILDELRSHLADRLQESPAAAERALAAFGDPETYAHAFVESADLRAALAEDSPPDLFLHLMKSAGRGAGSFSAVVLVLLLGMSALTFGLMALLKPIVPDLVGLWIQAGTGEFVFGIASQSSREGASEVLGYWLIPIALASSIVSMVAATRLQRRILTGRLRSLERPPSPAGD